MNCSITIDSRAVPRAHVNDLDEERGPFLVLEIGDVSVYFPGYRAECANAARAVAVELDRVADLIDPVAPTVQP